MEVPVIGPEEEDDGGMWLDQFEIDQVLGDEDE